MGKLFTSSQISELRVQNRTIRSATWEGLADAEGFIRPKLVQMLAEVAKGNVGLVIPGYFYIKPDGKGLPWQAGICYDAHVERLKQLVDAVHKEGAAIAAQIAHAGGRTRPKTIGGSQPAAPSAIDGFSFGETPRELTLPEIHLLIEAFAQAARRAKEAGFDAVQLHAAHGYLLSQFLSPLLNLRKDGYGGTRKKRQRFVIEVYEAVRSEVGRDFPVFIKLNTTDGPQNGITPEESLEIVKQLESLGLDAVEVSGGIAGSDLYRPSRKSITRPSEEAYFRFAAKLFKEHLRIPVILVGGIKSYEVADNILREKYADFVSFSRPLICEPDLILRWYRGDISKSRCLSCNLCLQEGLKGSGIACAAKKKAKNPIAQDIDWPQPKSAD